MVLIAASAYQAAAGTAANARVNARPAALTGSPTAYRPATLHKALPRTAQLYAVRHGDTLSSIAAARCGRSADWTGIYAASRAAIGGDPNLIYPGQRLTVSCRQAAIPRPSRTVTASHRSYAGPRHGSSGGKIWGVTYGYPYYCGDGDGDGYDEPCSKVFPHRGTGTPARSSYSQPSGGSYHGSGSMQQCIIARESGGNSQVMNSTGHYGLYQFSYSTWTGSGGNGADFGHASVAEQNQVYYNAVAARGYSDWAPYDGC